MGSMGLGRWALADWPWPISGPEADGAPWAPWASGTPPWGYHLVSIPHDAPQQVYMLD